jgi:hypothetical protein
VNRKRPVLRIWSLISALSSSRARLFINCCTRKLRRRLPMADHHASFTRLVNDLFGRKRLLCIAQSPYSAITLDQEFRGGSRYASCLIAKADTESVFRHIDYHLTEIIPGGLV